jgi:pyruvate, water dikinase
MAEETWVRWLENLSSGDVATVGGKNASLGEMIGAMKEEGIRVPDGFATTAEAYWQFIDANGIRERIVSLLEELKTGEKPLDQVGKAIRRLFYEAEFPEEIAEQIRSAYRELSRRFGRDEVDVAVRSSATAEDLPEASFAGQQETFLNVTGESELLDFCRKCFASLFTDRAIIYRDNQGFDHMKVALSVGVQKMVRSDKASAGVMFSIDTETGFPEVVVINAAWGLGENVVQGSVTPDEYMVFKPLLTNDKLAPIIEKSLGTKERKLVYVKGVSRRTRNVDTSRRERHAFALEDGEILQLARWAVNIEKHYGTPMDIEWARDGDTGDLFIVQARPETVQSQKQAADFRDYELKGTGEKLVTGLAIGQAIAAGKALVIKSADEIDRFQEGSILVTGMTDPDWVPIMKKAAGIVTDFGGRTSHAAIVSRELGIAAVVGTGNATRVLKDGQEITISCAEGDQGYVYGGILDFEEKEINLQDIPETRTRIMMNIASPAAAFRWWRLPSRGIGLARMEFIINNIIKVHPMALVKFDEVEDRKARRHIEELTEGYADKTDYFVEHLSRGIARIAASQYPEPVIVRMSDFKTNEYAGLIGGAGFEPHEDNPMLGWRGASRYYHPRYREGFALECRAIRRVREEIGLTNVIIMIPFCRTLQEADRVLEVLAENGLKRGEGELEIYVMAEIPSNILLATDFAERFDGFSIGSNDLTQLVLGVDRDSGDLAAIFDERNEAVKKMIRELINTAHEAGSKVGICGQAPSDYPDFAAFLVEAGIDSISLNPDSVLLVKQRVAEVEGLLREGARAKKEEG